MRHDWTPTVVVLLTLAGCGAGGDVASVDLSFSLDSSLRAAGWQAVDADGSVITVQTGQLALSRIDLELPPGVDCDPAALEAPVKCDDDESGESGSIEIEGPFVVDLAAGTVDPSLDGLTIPAGTYEHVDLRLSTDAAGDGPSFVASGTLADPNGEVAWQLALEIDEDARFEAPGGIEIAGAADVMVLLDVALWFADAPVSSCLADGLLDESSGVIWLDDSRGCDLVDPLEDAVKESGRVEGGSDDDGPETED